MRFLIGFLIGVTLGYGVASLLTMPEDAAMTATVKTS